MTLPPNSLVAPLPGFAARLWSGRPVISGLAVVLIATLWMLAAYNADFWRRALDIFGAEPHLLILFAVGIWAFMMVYVLLFANRWLLKPFLIANILIAAGASYYHEAMGIIIDREMIGNIIGTTANESWGLFTAAYLRHMLLLGVLPSAAILMVRVTHPAFARSALQHLGLLALCAVVFLGAAFSNYQAFSFGVKASPGMRQILHPASTIQSAVQYAQMMWRAGSAEFTPIALDAAMGPVARAAPRPTLTILVIGETLRDQNWGLSGYARDTTPELAKRDILAFGRVETCGTSTNVSLPCMFSALGRADFSYEAASSQDNLLDILKRAGYDVEWWDANTGDMGVAARVPYANYNRAEDPEFCASGECNDGILLMKLQERAGTITRDTVIVMHQIGNHGPAYSERYPEDFARFLPDCRNTDLAKCPPAEIVNAYDNAVAYTDHLLSSTIDFLDELPELNTSLIYISDHGESLGEGGLYLHAAPYWIAPETQKRVPMVVWMSEQFQLDMQVNYNCVKAPGAVPLSQDNFIHSVLGMLDVSTAVRKPDLDIFDACRTPNEVSAK
ncbi:phosphoethanolamine transferase [Roseovarius nanhaiticus]|uniref:phosphoethanolamine transferase n=1 Tax=Roseovarius nanhaiticus TaxID=573024 RepID=UPI0024938C46|nr:phosphoethanolamine--lipid A transferase [Roseovarius nanhaiticus]